MGTGHVLSGRLHVADDFIGFCPCDVGKPLAEYFMAEGHRRNPPFVCDFLDQLLLSRRCWLVAAAIERVQPACPVPIPSGQKARVDRRWGRGRDRGREGGSGEALAERPLSRGKGFCSGGLQGLAFLNHFHTLPRIAMHHGPANVDGLRITLNLGHESRPDTCDANFGSCTHETFLVGNKLHPAVCAQAVLLGRRDADEKRCPLRLCSFVRVLAK